MARKQLAQSPSISCRHFYASDAEFISVRKIEKWMIYQDRVASKVLVTGRHAICVLIQIHKELRKFTRSIFSSSEKPIAKR
jgi:hypothetical protein